MRNGWQNLAQLDPCGLGMSDIPIDACMHGSLNIEVYSGSINRDDIFMIDCQLNLSKGFGGCEVHYRRHIYP